MLSLYNIRSYMTTYVNICSPLLGMLAYAGICWHMLAHAGICWHMLTRICQRMLTHTSKCWHLLIYAGTCCYMLACVSVCQHMLADAGMCQQMLAYAIIRQHMLIYGDSNWLLLQPRIWVPGEIPVAWTCVIPTGYVQTYNWLHDLNLLTSMHTYKHTYA